MGLDATHRALLIVDQAGAHQASQFKTSRDMWSKAQNVDTWMLQMSISIYIYIFTTYMYIYAYMYFLFLDIFIIHMIYILCIYI